MKTTHLVRIAATHTACGKPRGDFAPTNITLIHGHASCLGCVVDISKRALETLTRIVRENGLAR